MPAGRRKVLEHLAQPATQVATTAIGTAISLPTTVAKRHLEDLEAHGVVTRTSQGQGKPDLWERSDWTREHWLNPAAGEPETYTTLDDMLGGEPETFSKPVMDTSTPSLPSIRGISPQTDISGLPQADGFPDDDDRDTWVEETF
jgi:hypothetical protein